MFKDSAYAEIKETLAGWGLEDKRGGSAAGFASAAGLAAGIREEIRRMQEKAFSEAEATQCAEVRHVSLIEVVASVDTLALKLEQIVGVLDSKLFGYGFDNLKDCGPEPSGAMSTLHSIESRLRNTVERVTEISDRM